MSELSRQERLMAKLLEDARNFFRNAQDAYEQGDWHKSFAFSTLTVGYCERYTGGKAQAQRVASETGVQFSLQTMCEGENHPGNTVIQCPDVNVSETRARAALRIADEYWSEIDLGVVRVIGELGRGGYGVVEHILLSDGSESARKTFDPANLFGTELENARIRFRREVRAQQQLQNLRTPSDGPVVLPVLRASLDGQHLWFTMPLAQRHLRQELLDLKCDNYGRIELIVAAEPLITHILELVTTIHQNGVVHRDLKPENILQCDGNWVLADFGLCILSGSNSRMTSTGRGLGTESYLAPEQFHSAKEARTQSDIYSLGCVLDDLFGSGYRVPYSQVLDCPGAIGEVIKCCTHVDPSQRYPDIVELHASLQEAVHTEITC